MGDPPEASRRSSHGPISATTDPSTPSAQTAEDGPAAPMTSDNGDDPSGRTGGPTNTEGITEPDSSEGGNKVEEQLPPLPPRPPLLEATDRPATPKSTSRPTWQAKATTAVSSLDIQTMSFPDGSRGTFSIPSSRTVSESMGGLPGELNTPSRKVSRSGSELDDSASLMSCAPTLRANGDLASLLDEGLNAQSPAWRMLSSQVEAPNPFETIEYDDTLLPNYEHEFDEIEAVDSKGGNEGEPRTLPFYFCPDFSRRRDTPEMEVKAQALPDFIIGGQTNL